MTAKLYMNIEELVKQHKTKEEICSQLNISIYQLNKYLKDKDIIWKKQNARRGKNIPKIRPYINKEWLIENWVNTDKSMHQLSIENNISEALLDNRRAKYHLKKSFKYNIDKNKLFNLEDPNIYYLAGLLATDGYFPQNQNSFELELSGESEDKLLTDIAEYFDNKCALKRYGNNLRLRISCEGLNDFFEHNFNIPQKAKSFDVNIPEKFYSEDCAKAYIRGCIDGDGYIAKKPGTIAITTASEKFIRGLHAIILRYTGLNISVRKHKNYWSLAAGPGAYEKVKNLLDWIYSYDGLHLQRKYYTYKNVYYNER